jgi:thymidylate kinase
MRVIEKGENDFLDNKPSNLQNFINSLFRELHEQRVDYAICGNHEKLPQYTEHDIDIWAKKPAEVEKALDQSAAKSGFHRYIRNKTANGSNNFYCKCDAHSMEVIRFDILRECAWKSIFPLVKSQVIEKNRLFDRGFWQANPAVETAMHLLFPLLNTGHVRDKYKEKICDHAENDEEFLNVLRQAVGKKKAQQLRQMALENRWIEIENRCPQLRRTIFIRTVFTSGFQRLTIFAKFLQTNVIRLFQPAGLFVAMVGLDGAGKTSVIEKLKQNTGAFFMPGRTRTFYWRPFLLPPLQHLIHPLRKRKNQTVPEQESIADIGNRKTQQWRWKTCIPFLIKFIYYWLDFILGSVRYKGIHARGGLVLFDRYYYDQMVFPHRFRFTVPMPIFRLFSKLIPQPDVVILLTAPTETLISRKKEFPENELTRQLGEYRNLLTPFKNFSELDTDRNIEETVHDASLLLLNFMAEREKSRG